MNDFQGAIKRQGFSQVSSALTIRENKLAEQARTKTRLHVLSIIDPDPVSLQVLPSRKKKLSIDTQYVRGHIDNPPTLNYRISSNRRRPRIVVGHSEALDRNKRSRI